MTSRVFFEPIKTLGFAGISAAYATVGAATSKTIKAFCVSNDTEGDMYFSIDGTDDHMYLAAGSFRLYDLQSNMNSNDDDSFVLSVGTQFYVKQITAPVSGSVYVECIY